MVLILFKLYNYDNNGHFEIIDSFSRLNFLLKNKKLLYICFETQFSQSYSLMSQWSILKQEKKAILAFLPATTPAYFALEVAKCCDTK